MENKIEKKTQKDPNFSLTYVIFIKTMFILSVRLAIAAPISMAKTSFPKTVLFFSS